MYNEKIKMLSTYEELKGVIDEKTVLISKAIPTLNHSRFIFNDC